MFVRLSTTLSRACHVSRLHVVEGHPCAVKSSKPPITTTSTQTLGFFGPRQAQAQRHETTAMDSDPFALEGIDITSYLDFTIDLYKNTLPFEEIKNFILCPFSLFTTLAMIGLGANSGSRHQLEKVLRVPSLKSDSRVHPLFERLLRHLQKLKDTPVSLANAAFVHAGYAISEDFQEHAERFYGTQFFTGNFDKIVEEINSWISDKTEQKISKMVAPGDANERTRLFLLSAVYFKSLWNTKFSKEDTENGNFYALNGKTFRIPMMSQRTRLLFGYNENFGCSIVQLPYEGGNLSMAIYLPDENDGLPRLEKLLLSNRLRSVKTSLTETEVNVKLPRFQLETSIALKEVFIRMGLKHLFDEANADLSGISQSSDLFISAIQHKVALEVDEEGTVAAAATTVHVVRKRSADFVMDFVADHAFFFCIQDDLSGLVLFAGRFVEPDIKSQQVHIEL